MGNKGAFIRFEAPALKPNIVTFSAVVSIFCALDHAMLSYVMLSSSKIITIDEYVHSFFLCSK